ncbi:MAG: hypothetical protein JW860_14665 [Sedimentisphaerales bacterium]|nr:hypothetical protein [Sedimentisphaerales bacterium]
MRHKINHQTVKLPGTPDRPAGFTLIMLVITFSIALLMGLSILVYVAPMMHVTEALQKKTRPQDIDMTWVEEKWFMMTQNPIPKLLLSEDQLYLEQPIRFMSVPVEGVNSPRGKLELIMSPGGCISGQWYSDYLIEKEKIHHDIMSATFEGFSDPEERYGDPNRTDPDKLFFIARGDFAIIERSNRTQKVSHVIGEIYVTGWLSQDYSASGELHVISKERYHWIYRWSSPPGFYVE